MSLWSDITGLFNQPTPNVPLPNATITSDFATITAALVYLRPLGAELIAFEKAWKDHNTEEELMAGVPLIATMLKVVALAFPQVALAEDGISLVAFVAPLLVELLLKTGQNLIPDGKGGYVTKDWAASHQLNPDGTFKETNIFGF
jgi:hypothetical protein